MVTKIVRILSIVMVCWGVLFSSSPSFAQDKGTPVMKTVTFFTLGGGGAGAALGVAYYMLDPLNPEADIRNDMLVGMGLGTFAGLILGFVQLNKQAVMPNSSPMPDNEFNQPYLGALPSLPQNYQLSQNTPFQGINKPNDAFVHPRILLFGLQIRF